ncbi:RluA family pseudouridine synthase [Haliovirga abyssi]|uniref:tRNA pseudouridine synthase A n=1 Tax=Haliovirga abyssi TaxID=2996794 RepID=A0AAU9DGI1_9FUSO|nr:RluA family pseudouridine synthase [Haliovirga abyssi]BDU51368.1 tRNA pseudouridine synthase A [Haliovirga abyssi]
MKFIIEKEFENTRLDKFIRKKYEGVSLNEIFKLITKGKIKVNEKKQKQNYRLQNGDIINIISNQDILIKEKSFISLNETDISMIKSDIIYEDNNILIFNKQPGLVMHKGSGYKYGLSEMLKSYLQNMNFTFVNRIDKSTSGLIIGAKNLSTVRDISALIKDRKIEKYYYILVNGIPKEKEFAVKSFLKKTKTKVIELDKYEDGAKESISYFKIVKTFDKKTILEAKLGTGRTHQLRVQLSEMGLPIVGDSKYGQDDNSIMCLFSHRVIISKYIIDVNLNIPDFFH